MNLFLDEKDPPSAIFLEYIAGLEMIGLHDYTQQGVNNLMERIRQIHKALVRHRDLKPRNMMVVMDASERVFWIEFDRAEIYDEDQVSFEQKDFLEKEEEILVGFINWLVNCGRRCPS